MFNLTRLETASIIQLGNMREMRILSTAGVTDLLSALFA
jgi:hypothetical protein